MPAGFAGGFDADLDQHVFGGTVLSAVVGRHGQLVHVLLAITQFLCVLDEAWAKKRKGSAPASNPKTAGRKTNCQGSSTQTSLKVVSCHPVAAQ